MNQITCSNTLLLASVFLLLSALSAPTHARPVNFQGFLTQPDGTPIDASVPITIGVWDSATAGSLLYAENHPAVAVSSGRFSVGIGSGSAVSGTYAADIFTQDTWIELSVNGETMIPRTQLGAVGSAQHAVIAERLNLNCADGELLSFVSGLPECAPGCFDGDRRSCFEGAPATRGVGVCKEGIRTCANGAFGACSGQVIPGSESCNNQDDNCNGITDEGIDIAGCTNYYTDTDGDGRGLDGTSSCICPSQAGSGYATSAGDCDDADNNTFPGQTTYFTAPRAVGGFDYNCNSTIERSYTSNVASCTFNGSSCTYSPGFVNSAPGCGDSGVLSTGCSLNGSTCSVTSGVIGVTVACH